MRLEGGGTDVSETRKIEIATIPGDGVGPELVDAASLCLEALGGRFGIEFSLPRYQAGAAAYRETGAALPRGTIDAMNRLPATLIGAISSKDCPRPSPMGQMRRELELYADIRRCASVPGSPRPGVDILVVRECSEGFLPDRNNVRGLRGIHAGPDTAMSVRVITRKKSAQIARLAYELAKTQGRRKVTIAHKAVVFTMGCGLFREAALSEAARFPGDRDHRRTCGRIGRPPRHGPEDYDVIVTTNLFGEHTLEIAAATGGESRPDNQLGQGYRDILPGPRGAEASGGPGEGESARDALDDSPSPGLAWIE
jgi:isocitrate/isopropylmalate dehydrogenase